MACFCGHEGHRGGNSRPRASSSHMLLGAQTLKNWNWQWRAIRWGLGLRVLSHSETSPPCSLQLGPPPAVTGSRLSVCSPASCDKLPVWSGLFWLVCISSSDDSSAAAETVCHYLGPSNWTRLIFFPSLISPHAHAYFSLLLLRGHLSVSCFIPADSLCRSSRY